MCVQESNNINSCNFENYQASKNITLSGTFDGKNRIVYVWYKDKAGNISNSIASNDTYKIYLECSQVQYPKDFSSCSKVCGGGTQQKIATDKFTGKNCSSKTITRACNTQSCCSSTTVTGYGTCSKTCGGGVKQVYKKSNYNGQNCSIAEETVPCNTQSCCTNTTITGYGTCSKVCGGGVQQVYRKSTYNNQNCTISTETRACNTQSCCSSTTVTGYGTCSKTCGGGVKQVYKKSNYNGQNCSLVEETVPCNTQSCFPSINRVGNYLDGVIIPLNNSQKVLVKSGYNHEFEKGWYNDSYVKAQVINLNSNGTITSGPLTTLTNGYDACGEHYVTGVRVNDNTIFIAGASRLEKGNSSIKYGRFCGFSLNVNNTNFNMLSKNMISINTGSYSVDGIVYGKDEFTSNSVRVNIHFSPSATGTDYMHLYDYDIYTGSVVKDPYEIHNPGDKRRYDIEGIAYTPGWNIYNVEGIVGMKDNTTAWIYKNGKEGAGIYIGPTGGSSAYQYFIKESVYGPKDTYGEAINSSGKSSVITRIGTNKLIVRTAVNNNTVYLHFLKKVNGTWLREHVIQAPGYGDLLTGNDINYAYYNVLSKGLYAIKYD